MTRLAVLTLLAVLPAGGTAQRGDWPMPAKDYAATRYSDLTEITGANAGRLRPVWSFSTGVLGGHEGQPLVVDHTMYVVTPYPNVLYAFDLTREGYPLKWKYRPAVDPNALGIACCDAVNRGAFYADGKIVYNLLDGHTVAVAAATGQELWKTKIADLSQGETTPVAPLVVKHRVIVGASGGEFGIHGWLKGLDLETGRIVWTAYNIGPDSEVLAKPGIFKPFYDRGTELALTSWPADVWKNGGAPVWGWMSYDADLDLLYYGTGNPAPYNPEQRAGGPGRWRSTCCRRRPGPPAGGRHAGVGVPVHATRQLGLRRRFGDDPRRPDREWPAAEGPRPFRQERLRVYHRPRHGRGAGGPAVRRRQLGEAGGRRDRPTRGRFHQADGRVPRERQGDLSDARRRQEPGVAGGVLTTHRALLPRHQQHVHGLPGDPGDSHRRDAVHRREHSLPRGSRRVHGGVHRLGCGRR